MHLSSLILFPSPGSRLPASISTPTDESHSSLFSQYTGHTWSLLAHRGLWLHTAIYNNATVVSCPSPSTLSPLGSPPPSTLFIGYSVVKNVSEKSAATFCFLGSKLIDIIDIYKRFWASWPISRYHKMLSFKLGALLFPANIQKYQKWNLSKLLGSLTAQSKQLFVSGPLHPFTHSHTFPCQATVHLCYLQHSLVDKFNLFWQHPALFCLESIHPHGLC